MGTTRVVQVVSVMRITVPESFWHAGDLPQRFASAADKVAYDWDAIELALEEGISGTGSKTRGIGLFGVAEDMRKPGRQLIIHSGIGMLQITEEAQGEPQRTTLFPGTLISASIAT